MKVEFFHQCHLPTATAQQRQFTRSGKSYLPQSGRYAKAFWQAVMESHKPQSPINGPVELRVSLNYPHTAKTAKNAVSGQLARICKQTKPDLDNASKMILDAMTKAGFWKDDSQVYSLHMEKFHCDIEGIQITVQEGQL